MGQGQSGSGGRSGDRAARAWRISGLKSCCAPQTRVDSPDNGLAHLVTHYETWSPPATASGERECAMWVLPGEARLMVLEPGGEVSAVVGNRRYERLPRVVLFGPTSRATRLTASGGSVVTIGLSALGWAGMVGRSAAALGDRVMAAGDLCGAGLVAALTEVLDGGTGEGMAARIDAALAAAPATSPPDEPLVVGLSAIIHGGEVCIAEHAGERLGVASHVVRRSALRHFGYPPKVLLNRGRFVRALELMIVSERGYSEAAQHGYFDASHFIRDAKRFLGMTPRRFLQMAS